MNDIAPTLFVFAGNNGSGKSTIRNLIGEKIGIETSIDPDSLTRKYRRYKSNNPVFQAGKESLTLINQYTKDKRSFSFETTLSGKTSLKQIKRAKDNGFEIIMFFVGLDNIEMNIKRVKQRVKSGGHHIPTPDIIRREERTKNNLLNNIDVLNQLVLLDNTKDSSKMILNYSKKEGLSHSENMPSWGREILDKIKIIENQQN